MPVIDLAHTKYTWLYYFGPISSHFWDSWLKIMNKMINKLEFELVLTEVGGSLKLSFKYKYTERLENWLNFIQFFLVTRAIDWKHSVMNSQIDHERKPTQSVIEIGRYLWVAVPLRNLSKIYFSADHFWATIRPFAYFAWPLCVACKNRNRSHFLHNWINSLEKYLNFRFRLCAYLKM